MPQEQDLTESNVGLYVVLTIIIVFIGLVIYFRGLIWELLFGRVEEEEEYIPPDDNEVFNVS